MGGKSPHGGGLIAVFRKELADQLGSRRFLILFALILLAGLSSVYVAAQSIRDQVSNSQNAFLLIFTTSPQNGPLPPFFTFISFLGPLVGLALAFDAINGEQNRGTLSHLLAQPIYRDTVINGKFLAALTTVAIMLASIVVIVSALGIWVLGLIPNGEELLRVLAFLVVCVLYVGFWLALATTFSVVLRNTATAALAGIASWIFFTFFVTMIADTISNALVSVNSLLDPSALLQAEEMRLMLERLSPNTLFQEATVAILMPQVRTLGPILLTQVIGLVPNPLPLAQSLLLVWPQVVGLLAFTSVCFAIAYILFMRREIRAL
jgi:ABC-2 type transport system permease protein